MADKYVIFDRDGTLIKHIHYLCKVEDVEFFNDVFPSLRRLKEMGYKFGIITNQSVIGRGLATESQVNLIHEFMLQEFETFGLTIDFIYFCPHSSAAGCECRKPRTKLGEIATQMHSIDLTSSFYIGDQDSDMEFARNLSIRGIGLRNPNISESPFVTFFPNLFGFTDFISLTNNKRSG